MCMRVCTTACVCVCVCVCVQVYARICARVHVHACVLRAHVLFGQPTLLLLADHSIPPIIDNRSQHIHIHHTKRASSRV